MQLLPESCTDYMHSNFAFPSLNDEALSLMQIELKHHLLVTYGLFQDSFKAGDFRERIFVVNNKVSFSRTNMAT